MSKLDMLDEELAALQVVNMLNEVHNNAQAKRRFHVRENPFDVLTEVQFIKVYQLTKECTNDLIRRVTPHIVCGERSSALDIRTKVLCALKFFASGGHQTSIGQERNSGMSQAAVSRCIAEVSDALNQPDVFNEFVKFPRNLHELCDVRNRILEQYGFPGCIGIIDCTHVAIHTPSQEEEYPEIVYVNSKGYHSINVQLVCDADLKILNVNARYPGSCSDAYIWNNSALKAALQNIPDEQTLYLLGDSDYPLRRYLLTPLANPAPGTPEQRYNNTLLSTRAVIEKCIAVLKGRFRCLLKEPALHYSPERASKIINACVILHNICVHNNIPTEQTEEGNDLGVFENNGDREPLYNCIVNPAQEAGRQLQQSVIQQYFT